MLNLPLNIDFSGKVAVVTGAGGLICGAMARAFAQSGAKVAALDLNEDAVKKLAEDVKAEGFIMEGYKANVLEPAALEEVHAQVLADLGPCDIDGDFGKATEVAVRSFQSDYRLAVDGVAGKNTWAELEKYEKE